MSWHTWSFDETKCMSFLIEDDELLEEYNETGDKVYNSVKKEFDNGPVYNNIYLRIKIKSYEDKINTIFHYDKMLKEGSHWICLSVLLTDSAF